MEPKQLLSVAQICGPGLKGLERTGYGRKRE